MEPNSRDWTSWSGGYEDLVEAARNLLELSHNPARAPRGERESYERAGQLNERLVRQYVSTGVVSPGERQGREVVFNHRHLLQLVAARHLLTVEGWKLPMIARFMASADLSALKALLPSKLAAEMFEPVPNMPVAQAMRLASRSGPEVRQLASCSAESSLDYLASSAQSTAAFSRGLDTRPLLSADGDGVEWLRFDLTDFTEVHVRADALDAWNDELVEELAENLKRRLRAAAARRRGKE